MTLRSRHSARLLERLGGVPSYHFEPVFARRLQRVIEEFRPDCIAVELPEEALPELLWAVRQWPAPCASLHQSAIFPFVPGDSILEAARLAVARGLRLEAVDMDVAGKTPPRAISALPDPTWHEQMEDRLWNETLNGLLPPPTAGDLAREAAMASRLYSLLAARQRVLWIGGAAHWRRIRERVANLDFDAPEVEIMTRQRFERAGLTTSALCYLTGRTPFFVARYAASPETYETDSALQLLATQALSEEAGDAPPLLIRTSEDVPEFDPLALLVQEESAAPVDAARVLLYARNLAATSGLRSTPGASELLRAAVNIIGPRYAGRMYALLTAQEESTLGALPRLSYETREQQCGLWLEEKPVTVDSYWPSASSGLYIQELKPVPSKRESYIFHGGGKIEGRPSWLCYQPDRESYRKFVYFVFRVAAQRAASEHTITPFRSGLADGIDARATLRSLHDGEIWVREESPVPLNITNAAIDWQNESEFCAHLQADPQGKSRGGWIDPSEYYSFGSCSRDSWSKPVLCRDPHVQLDRREWTVLTLDAGTNRREETGSSFYDRVILPLVLLKNNEPRNDDVYHWLDIMFRFCAGKPFAYFSRYRPSGEILRVAARHRVRLYHIPLDAIPYRLRERNRFFRFGHVSREHRIKVTEQEAQRQLRPVV